MSSEKVKNNKVIKFIMNLSGRSIFLICLGSLIQAVGICNIHAFSGVTEGGTIGLTLLIFHYTGLSPAISSLFINIGCYALGWKVMGKQFLAYSGIAIVSYSVFYAMVEPFAPISTWLINQPLLCAIIGALFVGVGVGLSVLGGGAPGGDDALAMSLCRKFKCKIEYIYLASDLIVLAMSLSYIPIRKIAYSLLTVIISGLIVGAIQRIKND